jgi:hypothetical protein
LGFALLLIAACGKKGPPLAPFVHIPAGVDAIKAERIGSDVYVTLTVPSQNIDRSKPADIARVDVFAVTSATAPPRGQFLPGAARIATIPVKPVEGETAAPAPASNGSQPAQGTAVTVRETLTSEQFAPKPVATARPNAGRAPSAPSAPSSDAGSPPLPHRFYMAIAFSPRSRSSPSGAIAEVPLGWTPPPPKAVHVESRGEEVVVTWEPSGDILGFLLDNPPPVEGPPFEDIAATPEGGPLASDIPRGPTRYNVYRTDGGTAAAAATPSQEVPWEQSRPVPVNAEPLANFSFSEPAEFGRTWCYSVRAVRGNAAAEVEGDPSPSECVTLVDTVPPAAPSNLTSVAGEGAITLIWDANTELDLAGYVVLRGDAGSATLQPLTETPIAEPRYTDRSVVAGKRYVYAVIAVDNRAPVPNRSGESNRVEETAK